VRRGRLIAILPPTGLPVCRPTALVQVFKSRSSCKEIAKRRHVRGMGPNTVQAKALSGEVKSVPAQHRGIPLDIIGTYLGWRRGSVVFASNTTPAPAEVKQTQTVIRGGPKWTRLSR
jgi:hypothetical protein